MFNVNQVYHLSYPTQLIYLETHIKVKTKQKYDGNQPIVETHGDFLRNFTKMVLK
jgi:hypothetical protein